MNLIVRTPDEWLAALSKPPLEDVSHLRLASDDLLVVCAGFEERAVAALRSAASAPRSFTVLVIHYLPLVKENRSSEMLDICREAGLPVIELTYNRAEPAGFGLELVSITNSCRGNVLIDVSAMSRLLIVQILVALCGRPRGFANIGVVYSEAHSYPPTEAEAIEQLAKSAVDPTFAVLFLSSGVFDVTVVPELSSVAPPGGQTRLLAFPSLDAHQLTAIRAEIQPSRFSFIEGAPPSDANAWRREAIAKLNQLDEIQNSERFVVSTLDYQGTLDLLLALYGSRPDRERVIVCPTGSKMQTVAVGIFRAFARDVQVVYPTPQTFLTPSQYTIGAGPLHFLDLAAYSHSLG